MMKTLDRLQQSQVQITADISNIATVATQAADDVKKIVKRISIFAGVLLGLTLVGVLVLIALALF